MTRLEEDSIRIAHISIYAFAYVHEIGGREGDCLVLCGNGGEKGKCGMEEEQFPVSFFKREREIKGKGERP